MKSIKIETSKLTDTEILKFKPVFEANKNYKDPVKIQEDLRKKEEQYLDEAHLSAFTGYLSRICIFDSEIQDTKVYVIKPHDEKYWLKELSDKLDSTKDTILTFDNFDVPFLKKRFWKNGLKVNLDNVIDVMRIFTSNTFGKKESLEDVTLFLLNKKLDGVFKLEESTKAIYDIYNIIS